MYDLFLQHERKRANHNRNLKKAFQNTIDEEKVKSKNTLNEKMKKKLFNNYYNYFI